MDKLDGLLPLLWELVQAVAGAVCKRWDKRVMGEG